MIKKIYYPIIKSLDPTKPHGVDEISIRMIQIFRNSIAESLIQIFENAFSEKWLT